MVNPAPRTARTWSSSARRARGTSACASTSGVGETRSCGTGACAAALATRFWAGEERPTCGPWTSQGTAARDGPPGAGGRAGGSRRARRRRDDHPAVAAGRGSAAVPACRTPRAGQAGGEPRGGAPTRAGGRPRTRKPLSDAKRSGVRVGGAAGAATAAASPSRGSSGPRGYAAPPASSRGSHSRSMACRAALPTRMGGLDQIAANRTSSGTSSGVARTPLRPRARVGLGQGHRPLVDVDRPHRRVGREKAEGEGDQPPAAPEVEQVAFRWRRRHLSQQHGRALVQAFGAEDAGRSPHGHGPAGQRQVQSALLAGAGRARREVVLVLAHQRTR